jgi:glyoxylase-like metal-dependent hydrolase (beta-lactamase superfamily II)
MLRTVLAANPSPMTLDGTRSYIVGHEAPVVIDPGPHLIAHLDAVESALAGRRPLAIVLTHAHPDHAAGAPELARRTGAPVRMGRGSLHPGEVQRDVSDWLSDGDTLETDAGRLRVLLTPGHTPEHLALAWTGRDAPAGGALFVGDLLMGSGDTTLVAPPEGDLLDYLHSLERLAEVGAGVLYPAHGHAITRPRAVLERYRAHRVERISQVVEALKMTPSASPEQLVDTVYGAELDPRLRSAAAGSIAAVLHYISRSAAIDSVD